MALKDIREQIKTILSAVQGVGRVHDYDRWAIKWNEILSKFKTPDGTINAWIITRVRTPEKWINNIQYELVYEFLIRGVYSLKDNAETEIAFQQIIEDICAAFRHKITLNDTCETIAPSFGRFAGLAGIQVDEVGHRIFGSVLCHYCGLGLGAQARVLWTA